MLGRSEVQTLVHKVDCQTLVHKVDCSLAVGQHQLASTESSKLLKAQRGDGGPLTRTLVFWGLH